MSELKSRGFLLKQRAFLKLYLLEHIQAHKLYGSQYIDELKREFESYGYSPAPSEVYKSLHELTNDGYVTREKKILGEEGIGFQEIIYYQLTEEGKKRADLYKIQMKEELDRCIGLLNKAVRDHYGPVSKL